MPRPLEDVVKGLLDLWGQGKIRFSDYHDEMRLVPELREALAEREKEPFGRMKTDVTVADAQSGIRRYVYIYPPQINGR